jgi:hypothetical protein
MGDFYFGRVDVGPEREVALAVAGLRSSHMIKKPAFHQAFPFNRPRRDPRQLSFSQYASMAWTTLVTNSVVAGLVKKKE